MTFGGAKRGANGARRWATQGDIQRRSFQLAASSGDDKRLAPTARSRLTSEKPVVRTHLRPTKFAQLDDLFGTLIGDPGTMAGNHRCALPDTGRVPSGPGGIPLSITRTRRAPSVGAVGTAAAYARWHPHSRANLFLIPCWPCAPSPSRILPGSTHGQEPALAIPAETLIAARRLASARPQPAVVAGIVHREDLRQPCRDELIDYRRPHRRLGYPWPLVRRARRGRAAAGGVATWPDDPLARHGRPGRTARPPWLAPTR